MYTIKDVMDTCRRAELGMRHFGSSKEWQREYEKLVSTAGKAIALDITEASESVNLSPDVELGPLGAVAYYNLRMFIKRTSRCNRESLF